MNVFKRMAHALGFHGKNLRMLPKQSKNNGLILCHCGYCNRAVWWKV